MFSIVGHSEEVGAELVAQEIIEQCDKKLNGRNPKGGILFAAVDFEYDEILEKILSQWPDLELIGGTTDGELSSTIGCAEDSIALMLFGGDEVEIKAGVGRNVSGDVNEVCSYAVDMAIGKATKEPQFCLTIPESLTTSGQKIAESLVAKLGDSVPLFGAAVGDQRQFGSTKQFYGDEVLFDSVPLLLFSGDIDYSFGIATGWETIGEPGIVTSSEGPIVHTINDKPAIEFYQKYLGSDVKPTGENPLVILNENGEAEYLRATLGDVNEETGAITFFADVPEGSSVQNSTVDRDAIIKGCEHSIDAALKNFPEGKTPGAAVIFSCAARKLLLGTRVSEESDQLQNKLSEDVEFCGIYGYGEISPNLTSTSARFHNETFITLLMGN